MGLYWISLNHKRKLLRGVIFTHHGPRLKVNFRKLGMNSLWRYCMHFNLGIIHNPTEGTTKFCPLPCLFHWSGI
ncbi:unnamed protein product [Rhodiola kirilowii]